MPLDTSRQAAAPRATDGAVPAAKQPLRAAPAGGILCAGLGGRAGLGGLEAARALCGCHFVVRRGRVTWV